MKIKTTVLIFFSILISVASTSGQAIFEPHYALKTPSTINIVSIETAGDKTTVNMSVENLVAGGYFCTDRNTYIITDNGTRIKLKKAIGIPYCNEVHHFSSVGEVLYFTLIFASVDKSVKWLDIVEECDQLCFSILGVATGADLNLKMNSCFASLDAGKPLEAAGQFEKLLPALESSNHALTGSVYLNLATIYESLDDPRAKTYIEKLKNSDVPHRDKLVLELK